MIKKISLTNSLFYNNKNIAFLVCFLVFSNFGFSQFKGGKYHGFSVVNSICPPPPSLNYIYYGGYKSGFASSLLACPIAPISAQIYTGGSNSGFASNLLACPIAPITAQIYTGGSNSGFAKNIKSCTPLSVIGTLPFTGGSGDGFAVKTIECPPLPITSGIPVYFGGAKSGFANNVVFCSPLAVIAGSPAYLGGKYNGFSIVSNACPLILPVPTVIFKGGAKDGFSKLIDPFACTTNNNLLPIELIYFKASCNENKVTIVWGTATQTYNDYFTLQKSSDAIYFESIAQINGAGTTSQILNYSYTDYNPTGGISYYRLCQTDFNGTQTYFNIIDVDCYTNNDIDVLIYPNPSKDIFNIVSSVGTKITVFNTVGQFIQQFDKTESNDIILDLTDYSTGIYFVKVESNLKSVIKKIIKY